MQGKTIGNPDVEISVAMLLATCEPNQTRGLPAALLPVSSLPQPTALAASLALHLLLAVSVWAPAWLVSLVSCPLPPVVGRGATALLVPAPSPKPAASRTHSRFGDLGASTPLRATEPATEHKLTGIQIAVLPDHARQLLPVLRRLEGRVALARLESPRTLFACFHARDLQPLGPARLDDWLAFQLQDPGAWPELAPLLRQCDEDCLVYALFRPALQLAILRAAARKNSCTSPARILLRFDATQASGFDVVSVQCRSGLPERKVRPRSNVSFDEGIKP